MQLLFPFAPAWDRLLGRFAFQLLGKGLLIDSRQAAARAQRLCPRTSLGEQDFRASSRSVSLVPLVCWVTVAKAS